MKRALNERGMAVELRRMIVCDICNMIYKASE